MKKTAVLGTLGLVSFFSLLFVVLLFTAPCLLDMYAAYRMMTANVQMVVLVAFYIACVPAAISLACLLLLLQNIRKEQLFSRRNCRLIGLVSWCCIAVTAITLWAGFWYLPMFFITAAMVFVFLILRVIQGCFAAATDLKEENNLTI